ncbi:MAG: prepilin-type N-terminal cleavage/methylation domain-containing protein [Acetatifactor sp.]
MMRDTGKRRQLNNQGMTLVEVLVAMIIISVIGVAFLQSFSYAVKTNRLAKQKQEALSIAQTMMEAAKAYSVEEMDAGLDSLVFNSGTYSVNSSGNYKVTSVNGTDYDVTMKLTAGTAGASGVAVHDMEQLQNPSWETDGRFIQDINDEMQKILEHAYNGMIADPSSIIVPPSVPPATDEEQRQKVTNFLINGLSDPSLMEMDYFQITNRKITMKIRDEGGNVTVTPIIEYTYKITDYNFQHVEEDGTTTTETFSRGPATVTITYPDCFTGSSQLRAVYVCFYPLYSGLNALSENEWIGCDHDTILIDSDLANHLSIFLIKQKLPASDPTKQTNLDTQLITKEAYTPSVAKTVASPIDVYHNLSKSLYQTYHGLVGCSFAAEFTNDGSKVYSDLTRQVSGQQLLYDVEIKVSCNGTDMLTLEGTTNAR